MEPADEEFEYFGLCAWFVPGAPGDVPGRRGSVCASISCANVQQYVPHPVRQSLVLLFRFLLSLERRAELFAIVNHTVVTEALAAEAAETVAAVSGGEQSMEKYVRSIISEDQSAQSAFAAMCRSALEVSEERLRAWLERLSRPGPLYSDPPHWPTTDDCKFVATLCAHLQRAGPEYQLRPLLANAMDPHLNIVFLPNTLPPAYAADMKAWAYRGPAAGPGPAARRGDGNERRGFFPVDSSAATAETASGGRTSSKNNIFAPSDGGGGSSSSSSSIFAAAGSGSGLLGVFADMWVQLSIYHPLDVFATAGQWAGAGGGTVMRADLAFFFELLFLRLKESNRIRNPAARMDVRFVAALVPDRPVKLFVQPAESFAEMHSELVALEYEVETRLLQMQPQSATSPWTKPLKPSQVAQCVPVVFMHSEDYQKYFARFPYEMSSIEQLHNRDMVWRTVRELDVRLEEMEAARVSDQLRHTALANVAPVPISNNNLKAVGEEDDDDDDFGGEYADNNHGVRMDDFF